jgi:hypothetical protein
MNNYLTINSSAICCTDPAIPGAFGLTGFEPDKTLLPAALRRRASLTTRLAITAAHHACAAAGVDTKYLPSIFASVGGEIQITDELCRTLPDPDALLSPTQFHNSVHNTTAGYWTILQSCQAPSTAIAALDDTFAIGLLEAAGQLQQTPGELLLVCYDEQWPQYLAPPMGKIPLACALVLSNNGSQDAGCRISPPEIRTHGEALDNRLTVLIRAAPAAAAFPLLTALREARSEGYVPLNISGARWYTHLSKSAENDSFFAQ